MATRAQVVERIAAVVGMNPMTVELILRYLAKAGLVPRGSPGKRSEDYFEEHLKNVVLALAAYQPIDAVEAVQVLNKLRCSTNALLNIHTSPAGVPKGTLFGDWIIQEIRIRITKFEDDHVVFDSKKPPFRRPREIGMSLTPPYAWNSCPLPESSDRHFDSFTPEKGLYDDAEPVLSRQTTFKVELLIVAGELLADTISKQTRPSIPNPASGRAGSGVATSKTMKDSEPNNAEPENEEANFLAGKPASSTTQPFDDTRMDTDIARKVGSPNSTDLNPRVCVSSRGIETPFGKDEVHDSHRTTYHHACA